MINSYLVSPLPSHIHQIYPSVNKVGHQISLSQHSQNMKNEIKIIYSFIKTCSD